MAASRARGLGVVDASLIVVGSIVGAGIFFVSPSVAEHAGSPVAFIGSWLAGGLIALGGALSNGELGGLFPRSGGEYVYLREAYGPLFGFLSGWMSFWIGFPGSIAVLASGLGTTVAPMLGLSSAHAPVAIGAAAIVALTAINAWGLQPGKWTQNTLSSAKLLAFAGLLALGLLFRHGHDGGFLPATPGGSSARGLAQSLVPVMFAYSGWNAATYVSGEMRDASRSLGRALALGTGLCIVLYLLVNVAYLRAMPIAELAATPDPARVAATRLGGASAAAVLSPLIALCVLSSMQASVLVGPRIYHAMAADGLFFAPLGRLHATTRVPLAALLLQSAVALAQLLTGSFEQLLTFATFAIVAFSTLTVAAVVVLRVRRPEAPRAFRVPGGVIVPCLFVGVNAWVLWNVLASGARAAYVGLAIVATGVPAYAAFAAYAAYRKRARPEETAR
ncbi:MAG TPA: amino acid permease [Polyangiaceae bacterium]|nr:amino acid permease [Polyangiaceae bacterium]